MAGDVGTSNGVNMHERVQGLKNEAVNDGFEYNGSEGSSDSKRYQTYKRRKRTPLSWECMSHEDVRISVEDAYKSADQAAKEPWDHLLGGSTLNVSNDVSQRQWRRFVLEHMYQSLGDEEGGIRGCIQDALVMTVKESNISDEGRWKSSSQIGCTSNGSGYAAKGCVGAMSSGALDGSHCHSVNEMCQHAFLKTILSEKFTLLCKLLFENFQGMKVDTLFSLTHINQRMKEGAYEQSPMLFYDDVDQFWRKLIGLGTELISLAKSLLDASKIFYNKQIGGSVDCTAEDEKPEMGTQESNSHGKPDQTEACCMYRVCTCRHCGGKADGRNCLVCDSCEDMYHISCIEPAVKEIPPKSWYCGHCIAKGLRSPHNNCVVCERMNLSQFPLNQGDCENGSKDEETFNEFAEGSDCSMDDGIQVSESSKDGMCFCKFCGNMVQNGDKLKICDHSLCPNNYYHVRCLTSKQLKSYGPRWYCPSCLCRVCLTDKDDDKIVLCDGCDHAYHLYCMFPPRTSIPEGEWFCRLCDVKIQEIRRVKRAYEQYATNKLKKKAEGDRMVNEKQLKETGEGVKSGCASQLKEPNDSVKWAYEKQKEVNDGGERSCKDRQGMDILLSAALEL